MEKENLDKIRNYYKEAKLFLPYYSNWRYFTFKLQDNTFKRFHIKSENELRKLLIKYTPIVAYYSSGQWLNAESIRGKKNKNFPIKLGQDLIFDIDDDNFLIAQESCWKIILLLGKPDYIIMTRRGFHLLYKQLGNKKQEYCKYFEEIKNIDIKCTLNEFGVFSIPLTLNKAGKVNIFLEMEDLNKSIEELIAMQPQIYIPTDLKENREREDIPNEEVLKEHSFRDESSEIQSKINKARARTRRSALLSFNNRVKKGLFIPILIYKKDFKGLKRELDYITRQYNLGDLYVFNNENELAFISLSVMDEKRLIKLLNSSSSLNKLQQKKFHKTWLNYGAWIPLAKLEYSTNKFFRASKKHYNALLNLGFKSSNKINEFVGNDKLAIYEVGIK